MIRLHSLIFILLFLKFRTDLVSASKSTEEISAIIQSYSDGLTTDASAETQHVTTQIYPVQDREYVYDFAKPKYDNKLAFSNAPLVATGLNTKTTSSNDFLSSLIEESNESEEPKVFNTNVPDKTQHDTTQIYPKIEVQDSENVHDFTKAKYDNKPALLNDSLVVAGTHPKYTNYKDYSSASVESNESDEPQGPADHVIPFSAHENPREPLTRPNYTAPGGWAKPPPGKNITLEFSPTKFLAQVRDSHTVKHVPREYAMESAETSEEKENAARLKEVVKESKANTIYTEEGYEDAAYDHAGHIRDADFQEVFDRKFNEELETKAVYNDKAKPTKAHKKYKPRKYRQHHHYNFAENNKNQSEPVKEEKSSKLQLDLKNYRVLKNALNQSVINPKVTVINGIVDLERDLKNEYREVYRTSTEPYTYVTTEPLTTFKSPVTESIYQSKMDLETTTTRRNVFTIRPRKTFVSVTSRPRRNKLKKPLKTFSVSQNIDNYNAFTTTSYPYEPTQLPSSTNYGNMVGEYLLQNKNTTPPISYMTPRYEKQTVNPLAATTVNGHGPYLVIVTSPPEALTTSLAENQNLVSTLGYVANNDYNETQPIIVNPNIYQNPPLNLKKNRENYDSDPHALYTHTDTSKTIKMAANKNKRGEIKHRDKNNKTNKLKSKPSSGNSLNYIERETDSYMDYYNTIKSPKTSDIPISYTNYKPQSYANFFEQWPNIFDNIKPMESYKLSGIKRLPVEPIKQEGYSLMTKLLPPAPLSASEYATFYRQNNVIKPMIPTLVEMMPIIDAIHKTEYGQDSFPFLFRRKRSTFGFLRTPNFNLRGKKVQEIDKNNDSSQISSNLSKSNNVKYPENFHSLLNESPHIATKEVDVEIKKHFKNEAKPSSDELSYQSPDEFTSDENLKTSLGSKQKFKEEDIVEVQVPTLDFTSVYERDEIDPITQKPRVNTKKYPFYKDSSALRHTAVKYIVNPKEVPKKTLGGMEFYDSRVRECEEVNPDLEKIVPEDDELKSKRGPQKKKLRLQGLGDKIDCYKAKYFDETPFDNPLFIEKDVEIPPPPTELNPKEFASRILELPAEKEDYTILRGPKNPEFVNINRGAKLKRPLRRHVSGQNVRYHLYPKLRKFNLVNTGYQRYQHLSKNPISIEDKIKPPKTRSKMRIKTLNQKVVPQYQHLVYEDVMGNIMNLDKSKKYHAPKRGVSPSYSKYYKRDNTRQQGITGSKNLKSGMIDGLVPPPRKISDKLNNSKHRYNFTNVPSRNLRIYKRSVIEDNKNKSSKGTNDKLSEKDTPPFRIVFTTPLLKSTPEKQTFNSDKVNITVAQNKYQSVNQSSKYSNRSEADPGHYGRFSAHRNNNSFYETRRKEPKYNVAENTFTSSTLVPLMVKLYNNFTARIPRGSRNNQAKQQVAEKLDNTKPKDTFIDKSKALDETVDQSTEKEDDPKKQFVTFKPVYGRNKTKFNEVVTTTYASIPDIQEHKELVEFLKGNPPGYDETFREEVDTENKKKELYQVKDDNLNVEEKNEEDQSENSERQETPNNQEIEDEEFETEDSEQKKEAFGEDRASDDDPEEEEDNLKSDGDEKNDDVQDDKPFVRFSSRPDSPPESFEDERYADLGPRVNKPYFYHPPFDVPTYEKYALSKSVDHLGDDYGHEETEFSEKYVFPWEHDDEGDKNKEESENHSVLDYHEYPWEKRERREKERQKREKMQKKYGKRNFDPNYDDDSYGKASNIKFVYTPSKYKHLRGKKDVHALQSNIENYPSKFSSKYKSAKIEFENTDNEGGNDDIKKSILKYIENIETSTKGENVYTTPRKNVDHGSENITANIQKKNIDTLVINKNTPESLTTRSTSKHERVGRIISTTASSVNRIQERKRRIITSNNKTNDSETVLSEITNFPKVVQPTLSSKITRQRGRNRSNATISTTTPIIKPNIRRRTRLTSISPTSTTTPKPANEKRRRSFRITSNIGSNTESTTTSTISTSTSRTVEREHRSRVSKEMIITKTVEDNDGDDLDEESDKNTPSRDNKKSSSKVAQISRSKSRHRQQTKSTPDSENPSKKERVEKVTITMEETPDHVYETKEIDKDGIKGKFITITANNSTVKAAPTTHSRDRTSGVDDAEVEEIQRRMEAFKSFDSVIKDTEDLGDEPSSLRTAEKYVVGSLFRNLPLPLTRKLIKEDDTSEVNAHENEDEDIDQSEYDDDVDDDDEEVDDDDSDSEDLSDKTDDEKTNRNTDSSEKNASIIKDPNNRNYYYVENP